LYHLVGETDFKPVVSTVIIHIHLVMCRVSSFWSQLIQVRSDEYFKHVSALSCYTGATI